MTFESLITACEYSYSYILHVAATTEQLHYDISLYGLCEKSVLITLRGAEADFQRTLLQFHSNIGEHGHYKKIISYMDIQRTTSSPSLHISFPIHSSLQPRHNEYYSEYSYYCLRVDIYKENLYEYVY